MQIDEMDILIYIVYNKLDNLLNRYVYIDINYHIFLSIDYIDIYSYIVYWLE